MKFAVALAMSTLAVAPAPVLSTAVLAQERASSATETDPNAVRCVRRSRAGSRIRQDRVCMTNAEWEEMERQGRDTAFRLQEQGTIEPGGDDALANPCPPTVPC